VNNFEDYCEALFDKYPKLPDIEYDITVKVSSKVIEKKVYDLMPKNSVIKIKRAERIKINSKDYFDELIVETPHSLLVLWSDGEDTSYEVIGEHKREKINDKLTFLTFKKKYK
jgi:hypothetical protein